MSRSVLVFHRALGFVHQSIPEAVATVEALGREHGFAVEATDDPDRFTGDLTDHDALVFVHTSGNVVPDPAQRQGVEAFVADGGGFFGVHAAAAMTEEVERDWPWYRDLVGARFCGHTVARLFCDRPLDLPGTEHGGPLAEAPEGAEVVGDGVAMASWEPAVIHVEQPSCPLADGLADGETRLDEWYGFATNPRPDVEVVATVDESTYRPYAGRMGDDHPIAWWRPFGGGRSAYQSMGHAAFTWRDAGFQASVLGGIALAAGWRPPG